MGKVGNAVDGLEAEFWNEIFDGGDGNHVVEGFDGGGLECAA